MAIFDTFNVDGLQVQVHIQQDGTFKAEVDGEDFTRPTLKALKEHIAIVVRGRMACEIEASVMGWNGPEDVVITGKHSGNNNWMYRDADGDRNQMRDSREILMRLSKDDRADWKRLSKAVKDAEAALAKWTKSKRLDVARAFTLARSAKASQ